MKPVPTIICAALIFFGTAIIAANLIFGIPTAGFGIYGALVGDAKAFKTAVATIVTVVVMGAVMATVPLIFVSMGASLIHFYMRQRKILAHLFVAALSGVALPIFFWLDSNPMGDWKLFSITIPLLAGLVSSFITRTFVNRMREQAGAAKPYHVAC